MPLFLKARRLCDKNLLLLKIGKLKFGAIGLQFFIPVKGATPMLLRSSIIAELRLRLEDDCGDIGRRPLVLPFGILKRGVTPESQSDYFTICLFSFNLNIYSPPGRLLSILILRFSSESMTDSDSSANSFSAISFSVLNTVSKIQSI